MNSRRFHWSKCIQSLARQAKLHDIELAMVSQERIYNLSFVGESDT
jgi:hypothetical protein